MKKEEIWALIERVQQICPLECQVEIVPTSQSSEIWLVIIQFPAKHIALEADASSDIEQHTAGLRKILEKCPALKTAYLWEAQKIHKFHYETILPLLNDAEHFRAVYCCNNKFALYTHHPGSFDERFSNKTVNVIGTTDGHNYKYFGACWDTDWLIGYLMNTWHSL